MSAAEAVESALRRTFTATVVDELREQTGYNPRQRLITAQRFMLVVVEAFLMGQTLGFAAIRAIFVRRFGFVRPCPFQKRFKQSAAAAFFRAALARLVASVISGAGLSLSGPLAQFSDVRVYDGTGQRVRPQGFARLHSRQGRHQVGHGLQHQDRPLGARRVCGRDCFRVATVAQAGAELHARRAVPVRP